jgi:hypothetical protein
MPTEFPSATATSPRRSAPTPSAAREPSAAARPPSARAARTRGLDEADSALARWQPDGDTAEQYVVGWMEPSSPAAYKLGRVDGSGAFIEALVDFAAKACWGQRDDPFRVHANYDVVWAWFDAAGSTVCTSRACARAAPPNARRSERRAPLAPEVHRSQVVAHFMGVRMKITL